MLSDHLKRLGEFYRGKHILITGASGYIAWNLLRTLVCFDCTIICLSRNVQRIDRSSGRASITYVQGPYQDSQVIQDVMVDTDIIFHMASQTSVRCAEIDPLDDYEANVRPMHLLLEACRSKQVQPTIIFSGTSTQCGIHEDTYVGRSVVDKPITTYDFHKLQAEQLLKYYISRGWGQGVSLRLTNVYGPGPKSSNSERGVLNAMIRKALSGQALVVYGSGQNIRDYIFIDDVVLAFLTAPLSIKSTSGEHFLVGSGIGTMIIDAMKLVLKLVQQKTNQSISLRSVPEPIDFSAIDRRNFIADLDETFGPILSKDTHTLEAGINKTIAFLNEYR